MPEMLFRVRWPDETETTHYSPSLVVEEHLEVGRSYTLDDFLGRSRAALGIASERVRAKFGFPCARAIAQSEEIGRLAGVFPGGSVTILEFLREDGWGSASSLARGRAPGLR
jgi:uncharacterized repeat protein (TIGR04042 family)